MADPYAFNRYMHTQSDTRGARHLRDYAAARLELCQIRERLAEIESQHQPIADVVSPESTEYQARRDAMVAIAAYVVTGRKPEPTKELP